MSVGTQSHGAATSASAWRDRIEFVRAWPPLVIAALFFAYTELHTYFGRWTAMPEPVYQLPSITHWAATEYRSYGLLAAAIVALGGVFWERLRWREFEQSGPLRVLVFAACAVVTWAYAFNDVNLGIGTEPHTRDRLVLIALCGLVLVHPVFAALVLIVALPLVHELGVPLGYYTWTDKRLPIDLLILFTIFLFLRPLLRIRTEHFVFVWVILLAANYFQSGLAKVRLGDGYTTWWLHDDLGNLFVGSWENGWLRFLSEGTVTAVGGFLNTISPLLTTHTLVVELGLLFILWHRRIAIGLLTLAILLHLGILAFSGIFFWKWIVIDAAVILFVWRWRPEDGDVLFKRSWAVVGSIAIIGLPHVLPAEERIAGLAWFDGSLNQYYRFEAVREDGRVEVVQREHFAPLDVVFAQNRFHYLNKNKILVGTYGATTWTEAKYLGGPRTLDEVRARIETNGAVGYDPAFEYRFDQFMKAFFTRHENKEILLSRFGPPSHIQNSGEEPPYDGGKVRELRVRFIERYFDGERIHDLSDRIVHTVKIE